MLHMCVCSCMYTCFGMWSCVRLCICECCMYITLLVNLQCSNLGSREAIFSSIIKSTAEFHNMLKLEPDVARLLRGPKKEITCLPRRRRHAITFNYKEVEPHQHMTSCGTWRAPVQEQHVKSATSMDAQSTNQVDVHLDTCIGYVLQGIIWSNFNHVKQLGRSMVVLKVHTKGICRLEFKAG
jgi:hypothetical protein